MKALQVLDSPADQLPAEVVAAFFYTDVRPLSGPSGLLDWRLNGRMTALLLRGRALGRPGEHLLFAGNGKMAATWVLFAGGGMHSQLTPLTLSGLIGSVLDAVRRAGFQRVALALDNMEGMTIQDAERTAWDWLDKDRFRGMQVVLACRDSQG
jgi:hypothetical protein